jgi:hypothetical protein
MLATMHTAVRREIFVSVLLLSVLGSSVSEDGINVGEYWEDYCLCQPAHIHY